MSSKHLLIGLLIGAVIGISIGLLITVRNQSELGSHVEELKSRITMLENDVEIILTEKEGLYLDEDDITWEMAELNQRQNGIENKLMLLRSEIQIFSDLIYEVLFSEASLEELLANLEEYQLTEN